MEEVVERAWSRIWMITFSSTTCLWGAEEAEGADMCIKKNKSAEGRKTNEDLKEVEG